MPGWMIGLLILAFFALCLSVFLAIMDAWHERDRDRD